MKDFCDETGAKRLQQKIKEYWEGRGYDVDVDLVNAGFVAAMRSARTDVRSDMVNGMPRRRKPGEATGIRRPASAERSDAIMGLN